MRNPLFLLDEVDKMSMDFRGDPSSALLEVLDPEQNPTFNDHYLEVDFDLSRRDVRVHGELAEHPAGRCSTAWKSSACRATPRTRSSTSRSATCCRSSAKQNGLKDERLEVDRARILDIIRYYTREAGVRTLEREISKICRKVGQGRSLSREKEGPQGASSPRQEPDKYLGVRRFRYGRAEKKNQVGQVTGLAWTEVGGELLTIEAAVVPGKGKLMHTGQLGEVMQESVQAAMSVVRIARACSAWASDFYQKRRRAHPRARGRDAEGRPERRHRDCTRWCRR